MPRKKHRPEQILGKLREVEIAPAQEEAVVNAGRCYQVRKNMIRIKKRKPINMTAHFNNGRISICIEQRYQQFG
ncbi:hypothetical protein [Candidatus Lucifugimonas marina]|uniref:Transposase n=1 Tax=Candidatus Lucifugimonas marina TaxID=3038979 RepID=A0AAJ6CVD0_9CHLR|nr:hypothetical protein [SAR202 cluster bacterium JH702]MDG0870911.1 hypothetical protein [SAR202 cluster bacterium JH639]WFG35855.1 hypothetical protein GKN94_09155 [SAR202 cluster bacterium JH545]WFG39800.1 hypothetical protein GKO48_09265 [SAR202 cluster bacterium JH1073]